MRPLGRRIESGETNHDLASWRTAIRSTRTQFRCGGSGVGSAYGGGATLVAGGGVVIIGVPSEVKSAERRVGLTPTSVRELVAHDQAVLDRVRGRGRHRAPTTPRLPGRRRHGPRRRRAAVWAEAELVVKVKEPQADERALGCGSDQTLFTYLHLAPDADQTADLVASGATCIAYETVTDARGRLPLLAPDVHRWRGACPSRPAPPASRPPTADRACCWAGCPACTRPRSCVIGGGVVGENAIEMAVGLGADVTVLDRDVSALDRLARRFNTTLETVYSTVASLEAHVLDADLVIGAVLVHGARAPHLVTEPMVSGHAPGLGAGRRGHRPGRVLRDLPADHPRGADVHRPRRRPLLRGQHAGRGAQHVHLRPEQRHPALHPRPGREGPEAGAARRPVLPSKGLNVHRGHGHPRPTWPSHSATTTSTPPPPSPADADPAFWRTLARSGGTPERCAPATRRSCVRSDR